MSTDALTNIRKINASQAVAEGLMQEMERDERVVLLGEDVGRSGGVFGSSRNLLERFGPMRVRDTPISEMSFTGMGVGMAMAGLRPVVEIMFVDFIGVCLEQVYNAMAKIPYMSGGRVKMPMVIKTAGGNIGSGRGAPADDAHLSRFLLSAFPRRRPAERRGADRGCGAGCAGREGPSHPSVAGLRVRRQRRGGLARSEAARRRAARARLGRRSEAQPLCRQYVNLTSKPASRKVHGRWSPAWCTTAQDSLAPSCTNGQKYSLK